jgi:signal transduction histidine kinase
MALSFHQNSVNLLSVWLLLLCPFVTSAQDVVSTSGSVEQYLEQAALNKQKGDYKEATRYLNTAAMQRWEEKKYTEAIDLFSQSIELNKLINNASGIAKLHSNLGMIYADLQNYEQSLQYFQQSLDYRLKHGEKTEIISTYINKAVVLNNLKRHNEAAQDLEKALALATEMNDAAQMKSCYGMLAETYEKTGNQERTLHYFNLYKTFHEMIQRNKVNEARKETEAAKLEAMRLQLEKQEKEVALLNTSKELAMTEEELNKLTSEVRSLLDNNTKLGLAKALLENQIELERLTKEETLLKNQRQKIWIGLSVIIFAVLLLLLYVLYRNFTYKKRINEQLASQNEEIKTLNENLEEQVQKRTAELQNTLTDLERRNTELDQFSHIISHNLRAPVASILGLGKIINTNNPSDPVNIEIFSRLNGAVQNLDTVLSDLTKILHIKDNQKMPREKMPISVAADLAINLLKSGGQAPELVLNLNRDAEMVFCVKSYFESIFYNLFSNAFQYAAEGRPPCVQVASKLMNGHVVITCQDNGIGIASENFNKIFEPYKRLSSVGGGKGLGLYLVKTQVEAMGGSVDVSSRQGEGTCFTLTLPNTITA